MLDSVDILSWLDESTPVNSVVPAKNALADTLTSSTISGVCFEINREVLLSLLEKVIPVVPTRDIIPVLTSIKIVATEGNLQITGSASDMAIVVETSQVEVKAQDTSLIPGRTFMAIVKEAEVGATIYVEVTPHGLVVVAKSYTAEIALTTLKGFPNTVNPDLVDFYEIPRLAFMEAIFVVRYALPGKDFSGQDSLRMISIKNGKFTACDGARFQQVRIPKFKLNMQLPSSKVSQLLKVLSGTDMETVEVGETKEKLIFRVGKLVLSMNKLSDPYPNVEQLWLRPALSNDMELLVNKAELITAIKQVKVVANSTSNAIGFIIEDGTLKVTIKDVNDSTSATIACKWSGKPRNIAVNYIHLAEMLKSYSQAECRFLLADDSKTQKSPILLKDDDTMALATIAQMAGYRAGL